MSTEFYNRNWRMPNSWNGSTDNNSKVSNYSMSFDGSEFIDTNSTFNTLTSFSISIWFKANDTAGTVRSIVSTRVNGLSTSKGLDIYISANVLTGRVYDNGATEVTQSFTDTSSWHNVVMTYDGTTLELFLDNSSIGTATGSYDSTGATNLIIGKFTVASSYYFDGKIDHLSIFDYALSSSQVTSLYGNSTDGVGNPMSISPKPKAYYPIGDYAAFNGSEYLVNNGALSDYVFDFEQSSSQSIDIGSSTLFDSTSAFSFSTWCKLESYDNSFPAFIRLKTDQSTGFIMGFSNYDATYNGVWFGSSSNFLTAKTSGDISADLLGVWKHICLVYDGVDRTAISSYSLYINGVVQSLVGAGSFGATPNTNVIGQGNTASTFWDGLLSNVSVFNTSLPATGTESVESLYNYGTPPDISSYSGLQGWWKLDASATFDGSNWSIPDDSSNSNTGTSNGMTASNLVQSNLNITQPYSRYALNFDGTDDYISVPSFNLFDGASALSISFWIKADSGSQSDSYATPFGNDDATNFTFFQNNVANQLIFRLKTGAPGSLTTTYNLSGPSNFFNGNWRHILATYDGSVIKFTVDNGTTTNLTASGVVSNFTGSLHIGKGHSSFGNYFKGSISNVAVWTSDQFSNKDTIYNGGKPGDLTNLNPSGWWQLGENMSYVGSGAQGTGGTEWTVLNEISTGPNGEGTNLGPAESAIVNGVGTSGNGLSDGMGGADNIIGDAPYSTANAVSYGMGVDAKSTDVPS